MGLGWVKRINAGRFNWSRLNGNPKYNRQQHKKALAERKSKKMSEFKKTELEVAQMCGVSPEEYRMAVQREQKSAAINLLMTPDEKKICDCTGTDYLDYLKESGKLDMEKLLTSDEIDICKVLNIAPLDFYFAKKFKC